MPIQSAIHCRVNKNEFTDLCFILKQKVSILNIDWFSYICKTEHNTGTIEKEFQNR